MERVMEQKIKKVVEARTNTPSMIEALEAIAVFYGKQGGNTAEARKSLRQDLEKQNMALTNRFLGLLEGLQSRLEKLEAGTSSLEGHCVAINNRMSKAEQAMSDFVSRARELQKQRDSAYEKADKVTSFLEKFILSESEVQSLRSDPIDLLDAETGERPFFAALRRVQEIRHECSTLVGSKHQSAGFELLEALSEHQEAGFRRLHEWVLERCGALVEAPGAVEADTDLEENDVSLGMGLRAIQERPALYVHCQECLVQRRRDLIRKRFVVALTQGAGGSLRPIEMQAHDPVRYLGDMLAWTHQTIASEREFLHNLLRAPGGQQQQAGKQQQQAATNGQAGEGAGQAEEEALESKVLSEGEILGGIMEGLGQPLKMRVMQVLTPSNGLVLNFRLLNLLAFYDVTLANLLPSSSGTNALTEVLRESRSHCQRLFEVGLRTHGEALLASPPAYSMDLSAVSVTTEAGRQLSEILQVYESSLVPSSGLGYELDDILTALIEPVLRTCRLSSEGLDPSDAAVLMLNNAAVLQSSLSSHAAAAGWSKKLSEEVETWLGLLVRYQTDAIMDKCGLGPLLDKAEAVVKGGMGTLATQPGLDAAVVSQVMRAFYAGLFALPQVERLQSPKMRTQARQRACKAIAEAHRQAYELLSSDMGGYADRSFLVHTPDEVKILLDCD